MLTVSLFVEILRTRPRLVFWLAALAQALLWFAVPSLFYSAPPGDLATVLAVGREQVFVSPLGPQLAYWLADLALRLARGHMAGVYLLSQICIVVTYWAVFRLGSAVVGARHAALAVLLMVGVSVFTIGSPDFGPDILTMPLWALTLLHLWRALGEKRELYWLAVAADFGVMLLVSNLALLLLPLTALFVVTFPRARAAAGFGAVAAAIITAFLVLPNLILFHQTGWQIAPHLDRLRSAALGSDGLAWLKLLLLVVLAHGGAAILVMVAVNLTRIAHVEGATVAREPVEPLGRSFVYYFALAPILAATAIGVLSGRADIGGLAPLFVLSGLAVVVAAGDVVALHHQRLLGYVWFGLLLLPPLLAAAGTLLLPAVLAMDLKVAQPAGEIARYFTDSFERRTGRPLLLVAGDERLASLVAVASPRRPRVLHDEKSGLPRASAQELAQKGAIVVWRATDNAGTPPPEIRAQFPDLVAEVPRAFERALSGRAPLLRIGWALIRPRGGAPQ